jgi:hypothetical protein
MDPLGHMMLGSEDYRYFMQVMQVRPFRWISHLAREPRKPCNATPVQYCAAAHALWALHTVC